MKKLTVRLRHTPRNQIDVGQLAQVDRRIYFEYDPAFLKTGHLLSPFKWPLRPGLIEHTDREFGPLPGWIDDSLPDGWGLLLMDRLFRKLGIDLATVSPLDRLSYLGTRTMGALTYHPPADAERDDRVIDLHELGKNAERIYRGDSVEVLPELMRAGGSPGGARPKALIGLRGERMVSGEDDLPGGYGYWIVKFAAKADFPDAGPLEFAYGEMARAVGIHLPETRLFPAGKRQMYFGVRRFDRCARNQRLHAHTFGNLVHANFRIPSSDYLDLLKVTHALTRNHQDLLHAFRQMVFNVAAHNRDDHAKNFAFLMDDRGQWRLAPAYDICFAQGPGGEHTMTVMGEGRNPTREHVIEIARQLAIEAKEARAIIEQVNDAVGKWRTFAAEAGCARRTVHTVARYLRTI